MDQALIALGNLTITPWTIIGMLGALIFAGRWVVQIYVSHVKKKSIVPNAFWYMSATGNILLLMYFIFGAHDSVGIVTNILPLFIVIYNIWLIYKNRHAGTAPKGDNLQ
jgi:lipid-A-disaccharide synthase-like uncharacterized protein